MKSVKFIIILLCLFSTSICAESWYNSHWQYRQKITIDHSKVDGNLTNFPVLINQDILGENVWSNAQADGDDILFTGADGVSKLSHEIESYNSNSQDFAAWVRFPTLNESTNIEFYMYYGNHSAANQESPTSVWDPNFSGVWHLQENKNDSTSNTYNGTGGSPSFGNAGKIGDAAFFSTSNTRMLVSGDNLGGENKTYETWIRKDQPTTSMVFYSPTWQVQNYTTNQKILYSNAQQGSAIATVTSTLNEWTHLAWVTDGTQDQMTFYVNGEQAGTNDMTIFGPTSYYIGGGWGDLQGYLDEVRISNVMRSSEWLSTSYNNQYSPSDFFLTANVPEPSVILLVMIAGITGLIYKFKTQTKS